MSLPVLITVSIGLNIFSLGLAIYARILARRSERLWEAYEASRPKLVTLEERLAETRLWKENARKFEAEDGDVSQ